MNTVVQKELRGQREKEVQNIEEYIVGIEPERFWEELARTITESIRIILNLPSGEPRRMENSTRVTRDISPWLGGVRCSVLSIRDFQNLHWVVAITLE